MRFAPRKRGSCPTGKLCWASEFDASLALGRVHSSVKRPDENKREKRSYKCHICHHYHLTSQEKRESQ